MEYFEILLFIGVLGFLMYKKQKQVGDTFDAKRAAVKVYLNNHMLTCSFCDHDKFQKKECLLNTTFLTFFRLQMLNQSARSYICRRCGKVEIFQRQEEQLEVIQISHPNKKLEVIQKDS